MSDEATGGASGGLVAFLRGVNVGGRNKVSMAQLRELVQELGYGEVKTYLQSGNIVFDPAGDAPGLAAQKIEDAIAETIGLKVSILTRTAEELAAIVAANPLAAVANNPSRLLVTFLSVAVDSRVLDGLDTEANEPACFAGAGREIYVWAPNGVSETKLTYAFWEKRLGAVATARNWNTVTRLLELASG